MPFARNCTLQNGLCWTASAPCFCLTARTNARGCVVFCGASVGSRRPGTDAADQARLLQTLLDLAAPVRSEGAETKKNPADSAANIAPTLTAAEFIAAFPDIAPRALLLILAGWDPQQPERLPELARSFFGFSPDADFQTAAARVQSTPAQIEAALTQTGWGPFVRKLQEGLLEPAEKTHA